MGEPMRLTQAPLQKYRRYAAVFQAIVVLALIIGSAAYPSARADPIYGTGFYAVPGQLPYGIYIAHADLGDSAGGCTISTWTSNGRVISADSGTQMNWLTARIQAPAVAQFITRGCTPWIKVG
jgi:hypothetical protein